MEFGLFYFANDSESSDDRYRMLLTGAKFADTHGFSAVWTPERHFHAFGGSYPNPAVVGAAVAAITERVGIRAGSVVAPLHPPVRIAEEWSVVDNISHGRVGLSFASGWHAVDFAIRPENYANRRDVLIDTVDTVRKLWRGETTKLLDGTGEPANVRIFPTPVQAELPVWVTSAGNVETFRNAGRTGSGVLTHLLGQDLDDLREKIAAYREAYRRDHDGPGQVALMLHTLLGEDKEEIRELVREPFSSYLRSSIGLILSSAGDILPGVDPKNLTEDDVDFLVMHSFDKYFETGGLFGTVEDGKVIVERLAAIGVDEVACLIDFVNDTDVVLNGLPYLDELRQAVAS
ncbi:MAG TPA: LLM class flavin-dependent oxidoreductase [Pseudonocardiaceae bacterium]|jgi:natural product biosynthesis luciferase-like monooxygenase protein